MASLRALVKYKLLEYPSLYKSPVDALANLFCTGFGWDRQTGEFALDWVSQEEIDATTKIKLESPFQPSEYFDVSHELNIGRRLEHESTNLQRKWIEANIDDILKGPLTNVYFGREPRFGVVENFSDYASAFHFPDNIAKDHGEELLSFLDWWLVRLNHEYGVSAKDIDDISWWPQEAKDIRQKILNARDRLFPLMNNGKTFAQFHDEVIGLSERLVTELKAEEK